MKLFTKHPHEYELTYLQHFVVAAKFSVKLFLSSVALLVHSVFPFLFEYTASKTVKEIYTVYKDSGLSD